MDILRDSLDGLSPPRSSPLPPSPTGAPYASFLSSEKGECEKIDVTCQELDGHHIDWTCVLGAGALNEVEARGGKMMTCPTGTKIEPCSRYLCLRISSLTNERRPNLTAQHSVRKAG